MIRLGTLLPVSDTLTEQVRAAAEAGFESVGFFVWEHAAVADLAGVLERGREAAEGAGLAVSALSAYGNPLRQDETGQAVRSLWSALIGIAGRSGVPVVSGFAGRLVGQSVEQSIPAWKALFSELADQAHAQGIRLAFENCRLGDTWKTGKWNLAINPDAWELMFAALGSQNLGLEWEPCHQLEALADPHAQLETWARRVFHVHGKDARTNPALLAARGFFSPQKWHRSVLPGQGDSDWTRLLATLQSHGYEGSIDLEYPLPDAPASQKASDEALALHHLRQARASLKTEFRP